MKTKPIVFGIAVFLIAVLFLLNGCERSNPLNVGNKQAFTNQSEEIEDPVGKDPDGREPPMLANWDPSRYWSRPISLDNLSTL